MFNLKIFIMIMCSIMLLSACNAENSQPINLPEQTLQATLSPTDTPSPTSAPTSMPTQTPIQEVTDNILAKHSTKIIDKEKPRVNNIKIAAKTIDGTILKKGEVFSFNKIVGKRTSEKGYQEATVLVGKEKTEGLGGGVCQVSSTIYGAALKSNMEILERHKHEVEVSYEPNGNDASVNYDNLDLKFKNSSDTDVKITLVVNNENITAIFEKI